MLPIIRLVNRKNIIRKSSNTATSYCLRLLKELISKKIRGEAK
jgi:hypothetical protein